MKPVYQNLNSQLTIQELSKEEQQDYIVDFCLEKVSQDSTRVDQFSIWLLVCTGACISILISNFADIEEYVPYRYLVLGLKMMMVSALLGTIEKLFAFYSLSSRMAKSEVAKNSQLLQVTDKYTRDISSSKEELLSKGIWPITKKVASQATPLLRPVLYCTYLSLLFGKSSPYEYGNSFLHYSRQLVITTFQFLLLIAGLTVIVFNTHSAV